MLPSRSSSVELVKVALMSARALNINEIYSPFCAEGQVKSDQVEQQGIPFIGDFDSMGRVRQLVGHVQDISAGLIATASNGLVVRLLR